MSSPSSIHSRTPSPVLFRPEPPRRARTLPTQGQLSKRYCDLFDELSHLANLFGHDDSLVFYGDAMLAHAYPFLSQIGRNTPETQRVQLESQAEPSINLLTDELSKRLFTLTYLKNLEDEIVNLNDNPLTADDRDPGHQHVKNSSERLGWLSHLIEQHRLPKSFVESLVNKTALDEVRELATELTQADSHNLTRGDVQLRRQGLDRETRILFDDVQRLRHIQPGESEAFVRLREERERE